MATWRPCMFACVLVFWRFGVLVLGWEVPLRATIESIVVSALSPLSSHPFLGIWEGSPLAHSYFTTPSRLRHARSLDAGSQNVIHCLNEPYSSLLRNTAVWAYVQQGFPARRQAHA